MASWYQGPGVIFLSTNSPMVMNPGESGHPDGQFWLWSPLMIFSLIMAIVVGLILIGLLIYALFYWCIYGTCFCAGCWWCPQAPAACEEEPTKVHIRRPSRSDSCRSSVRSRSCDSVRSRSCESVRSRCSARSRSSYCSGHSHHSHHDHDDRKIVRINSCPSINESMVGVQPMIIQTIPAIQQPQIIQQPVYQPAPAPLPPPLPPPTFSGNSGFGGGELRVVIGGDSRPTNTSSSSVIVYDMGRGGSNGGGVSLGNGRSEYVLQSVDGGGTYRGASGAYNDGFDRDDASGFSDGHRSAVIDIGKGGGGHNFYPSLPQYDD